jgi:hypothetical protein
MSAVNRPAQQHPSQILDCRFRLVITILAAAGSSTHGSGISMPLAKAAEAQAMHNATVVLHCVGRRVPAEECVQIGSARVMPCNCWQHSWLNWLTWLCLQVAQLATCIQQRL